MRARLSWLLLPLLLAACQRESDKPAPAKAPAASAAVTEADMPPVQPRPDNLGPSVKWPAESARFQQIRRQAWQEGLDTTRLSQARDVLGRRGVFRVRIEEAPAHRVLADERWRIRVETPDGRPVAISTLHVAGGMPEHGHGLPTQPAIKSGGRPGEFVISGLQFNMPGWWEVSLFVADRHRDDSVTFNVIVE